jgi:nitroimidazol reductase NimA-like FMN-containing flavoprotein (pyridoxamine 5'-phosphate oxidase superfamily)
MKQLEWADCARLLANHPLAHLGVWADDEVYVTPISYVMTADGRLAFRTHSGRRLEAIRSHPRVCIEVATFNEATGDWKSVIGWGNATQVTQPGMVHSIEEALIAKYQSAVSFPATLGRSNEGSAVVIVDLDTVTGRESNTFVFRSRPGRW